MDTSDAQGATPSGDTIAPQIASQPPVRRRSSGGGALAAAMFAVGEILEPEKTKVEIAQPAAPEPVLDLDLDFDGLDPLE